MHLLVIFFIALLVFGPKKLPELGKGIGEGIRALKEGMKDSTSEQAKSTEVKSHRNKELSFAEGFHLSIRPPIFLLAIGLYKSHDSATLHGRSVHK